MNSDELENARRRKQRSRAHARGQHDLCLPSRCPDAPGAEQSQPVTTAVTVTESVTQDGHEVHEPGRNVTLGDNGSRQQQVRQREARALELVAQGWRQDDIAAELGYQDRSSVSRAVSRALSRQATIHGDELRRLTDAELTGLRDRLNHLLGLPGVSADSAIRCIGEIRKVLESRARLHGLEHPGIGQSDSGHRNNFGGEKGFFLVIDAEPARSILPYEFMAVNPLPGAGYLPQPAVILDPALFPDGATILVRNLLAEGHLLLDGMFFAVPAEHITDELLAVLAGDAPGAA